MKTLFVEFQHFLNLNFATMQIVICEKLTVLTQKRYRTFWKADECFNLKFIMNYDVLNEIKKID